MVGSQYQAEVPTCLSHYKEGEKGIQSRSPLCLQLAGIEARKVCVSLANNVGASLV